MSTKPETAQPPRSVSELLDRLDHIDDSLPKRLRQCAVLLRRNINLVAVSTVAEMAALADVAPSAFMRFCQALGFSGYSEMQALFRSEYAQSRPDYDARLSELRAKGAPDATNLFADFAEVGHKSLINFTNSLNPDQIEAALTLLQNAQMAHLFGMRRAYSVTTYFHYMLNKMGVPAMLHSGVGMVAASASFRADDVLFAVTYAPFSSETLDVVAEAKARGTKIILLTDSADCPVAPEADVVLVAREVDVEAFRVPTVSMTLVTTLAVALGQRVQKE